MSEAPPEVDATELDDEPGDDVVDVFAEPAAPEADPESPFDFKDEDWPEPEKAAPKPKAVNPFQAKVDAMLEAGVLPTRAVVFTVDETEDIKKSIRRQIQNAAGERATPQVVFTPADEGKLTVRFRLLTKRRITRQAPAAAAVDSDATAGDKAD